MEKIKVLHAYLLFAFTRHLQHQCSSSGLGLGLQAGSQTPPALNCSALLCLLPSHLLQAPAAGRLRWAGCYFQRLRGAALQTGKRHQKQRAAAEATVSVGCGKHLPVVTPEVPGVFSGWLERKHVQSLCVNREEGTEKKAELS